MCLWAVDPFRIILGSEHLLGRELNVEKFVDVLEEATLVHGAIQLGLRPNYISYLLGWFGVDCVRRFFCNEVC
jgi:hypothetical protein